MKSLKNWLVVLDNDERLEHIVKNVSFLADQIVPKHIQFIYVQPESGLPKDVLKDIPDLLGPSLEKTKQELTIKITASLHADHSFDVAVKDGKVLFDLLKFTNNEKTDLLILDRNSQEAYPQMKLIRKTASNVLILPEHGQVSFDQVLMPIDYSEYTDLCFRMADELFEDTLSRPNIHVLNMYVDGSRYLDQVFDTIDEIQNIWSRKSMVDRKLEDYAKHEMAQYLESKNQKNCWSHVRPISRGEDVYEKMQAAIREIKPTSIILGSKGKDRSRISLMGRLAEKMAQIPRDQTVFIVKMKDENGNFLRNLLGM